MKETHWILLCAVGMGLMSAARVLVEPGLIGHAGGEVYGHAWVQWWHGQALPDWPTGTNMAIGTESWPVIDPLPTALAAVVGRAFGVVAGANIWPPLAVAGAFAGGAWLAKQVGGDPWVGGFGTAMAPAFIGSLHSGLSEDGAIGLAAVAMGLAATADSQHRRGLLCGLTLGILAWCGLLLAWMTGLACLILGLFALKRNRGCWKGLIPGAALTMVMVSPLAWMHADRLQGVGHRTGQVIRGFEPLWRANPWQGVDLATFLNPGRVEIADALVRTHPGYLGISLVLLAAHAGRSRWWAVLVPFLLLAPGQTLRMSGQSTGIDNPFAVLIDWIPLGGLLNHHGRLLLVGAIALVALAARGANQWKKKRAWAGPLVALDLMLLGPIAMPLTTASASVPDVITPCSEAKCINQMGEGPLLMLPISGPGVHFQRPLFQQHAHNRPLVLSPNRPGLPPTLSNSQAARWLASLSMPEPGVRPTDPTLPGVAVLMATPDLTEAVSRLYGAPDRTGKDGALWDLTNR